jgi:hypothetical protein
MDMTVRTAKLLGRAYSDEGPVSLDVAWNGVDVFSGPVLTHPNDQKPLDSLTPRDFLCEWTFPMDVYGDVPIRVTVTGGELWWQALWTNFAGMDHRYSLKLNTTWTKYQPQSAQEAMDDFSSLTEEEFVEKYGAGAYDNFQRTVVTPAAQIFMGAISVLGNLAVDNDGKNNVRIDGIVQHMDLALRSQGVLGDWLWRVNPGQVIEADVTVDPPTLD